jgi:hypothetical protein
VALLGATTGGRRGILFGRASACARGHPAEPLKTKSRVNWVTVLVDSDGHSTCPGHAHARLSFAAISLVHDAAGWLVITFRMRSLICAIFSETPTRWGVELTHAVRCPHRIAHQATIFPVHLRGLDL